MKPEMFIKFVESLYHADDTSGNDGKAKTYMNAIYVGYEYPGMSPPNGDERAENGHKLGVELRERLK